MVFGPIKSTFGWHWRCDVLCPVFLILTVDIDMNTVFANIVAELAFYVMIIADNRMPFVFVFVFQLNDKPSDLSLCSIVS